MMLFSGHRHHVRNVALVGLVGLFGLVGAAAWLLSSGSGSTSRPTAARALAATRHVAEPAGATPSTSAQMVCALEAQQEIAKSIGRPTTAVSTPRWRDHVYSCRYIYSNGVIGLSVKELSNESQTRSYFSSLQAQLGQQEHEDGLGQGAFETKNGSLVVRKDYKVLFVDASGLPSQFGSPPQTRKDVAIDVALTVLGCWTGA